MRKEQGPKLSLDFRNPMNGSTRFTKTNRISVGCLNVRTITDGHSAERVSPTWAPISNLQSNRIWNTFRKPVQNPPDIRIRRCKLPSQRPWSHRATYELNIALDPSLRLPGSRWTVMPRGCAMYRISRRLSESRNTTFFLVNRITANKKCPRNQM
jgi:hypothetical protein